MYGKPLLGASSASLSKLNKPTYQELQPLTSFSRLKFVNTFLAVFQMMSNKCRAKLSNHFCSVALALLLGQSNTESMISLLSTTTARFFSLALIRHQSIPQRVLLQVFSPCNSSWMVWHLSSLNSFRLLLSHSSSLSTFPWAEALVLNTLTTPPTLESLTNLMRVQNVL